MKKIIITIVSVLFLSSPFIASALSAIPWFSADNGLTIYAPASVTKGSIGTTTPFGSFQIASTTASNTFKPQLVLTDNGGATNLKHWTLASEGGVFTISSSTDLYATSTALTILNNGKVGIGTNNPGATSGAKLDVQNSGVAVQATFGDTFPFYLISNSPNLGFNAYFNASWKRGAGAGNAFGGAIGYAQATGDFQFWTSSASVAADAALTVTNLVTIKQSGNVGIGSGATSPTAVLHIIPPTGIAGSNAFDALNVAGATTAAGSGTQTGNGSIITIKSGNGGSAGNVGVGGNSGALTIQTGIGGTGFNGSPATTGGDGGALNITGGNGGIGGAQSSTAAGGVGSAVTITTGNGGRGGTISSVAGGNGGAAGAFNVVGGTGGLGSAAGLGSNANGGNGSTGATLTISAGPGGSGGAGNGTGIQGNGGNGGNIAFQSGAAGAGTIAGTRGFITFQSTAGLSGFGTTTPWAKLSVNPIAGDAIQFAVGSSTFSSMVILPSGATGFGTSTPFQTHGIVARTGTTTIGHGDPTHPSCDQFYSTPSGTAYREYFTDAGVRTVEAGFCQ